VSTSIGQRTLGRTGFRVGEIGLGFEHLRRQKPETIAAVVSEALENEINYFDLVWSLPNVLRGVKIGINGRRERVRIAVHLGSGHKNGRYLRSRKADECKRFFDDALSNLGTDYADIANIHYVKDLGTWKQVNDGGVVDLAC
jgi:predicted aldo/keto reductase-like oxidoreductase